MLTQLVIFTLVAGAALGQKVTNGNLTCYSCDPVMGCENGISSATEECSTNFLFSLDPLFDQLDAALFSMPSSLGSSMGFSAPGRYHCTRVEITDLMGNTKSFRGCASDMATGTWCGADQQYDATQATPAFTMNSLLGMGSAVIDVKVHCCVDNLCNSEMMAVASALLAIACMTS